jgi:hypothetical protein
MLAKRDALLQATSLATYRPAALSFRTWSRIPVLGEKKQPSDRGLVLTPEEALFQNGMSSSSKLPPLSAGAGAFWRGALP